MIKIRQQGDSPIEAAAKFLKAANAVRADGGNFSEKMTLALAMLQRFVDANIEADTGRTRGSVFPDVSQAGNSVIGMLGTNVRYSPFVRDAGHRMQFFKYAKQQEVPNALKLLGEEIVVSIEEAFE